MYIKSGKYKTEGDYMHLNVNVSALQKSNRMLKEILLYIQSANQINLKYRYLYSTCIQRLWKMIEYLVILHEEMKFLL